MDEDSDGAKLTLLEGRGVKGKQGRVGMYRMFWKGVFLISRHLATVKRDSLTRSHKCSPVVTCVAVTWPAAVVLYFFLSSHVCLLLFASDYV